LGEAAEQVTAHTLNLCNN